MNIAQNLFKRGTGGTGPSAKLYVLVLRLSPPGVAQVGELLGQGMGV